MNVSWYLLDLLTITKTKMYMIPFNSFATEGNNFQEKGKVDSWS